MNVLFGFTFTSSVFNFKFLARERMNVIPDKPQTKIALSPLIFNFIALQEVNHCGESSVSK